MENFRIDSLGKNHKIVVSKEHTFGTDAVLLSNFANIKRKDKAVDLGTGCGVIPLLWCKGETSEIAAVEIQQQACRQLEESIILNSFEGRIQVINCDLRNIKEHLNHAYFDLVTMNPPYKPVGTGIESSSGSDKIARHETFCTIDDVMAAAKWLLKFGGRICICHRPERLADIVCAMRAHNIELKRLRFVCKTSADAPWLVLVEGRMGGKSGLIVEPNLFMYEGGEYTKEVKEMFSEYSHE